MGTCLGIKEFVSLAGDRKPQGERQFFSLRSLVEMPLAKRNMICGFADGHNLSVRYL